MRVVAELAGANKIYKSGDTLITALDKTDLTIKTGELLLIIGPSGSGKTTLLSLLGCVIYPTSGQVIINGVDTKTLNSRKMAKLRLENIGFVFQSFLSDCSFECSGKCDLSPSVARGVKQ